MHCGIYKRGIIARAEWDETQISALHGYFGGAFDATGKFIEDSATWRGENIPVVYPKSKLIDSSQTHILDGTTLFAGPLFDHYGHFLLESTARLWAIFSNNVDRILFQFPGKSAK